MTPEELETKVKKILCGACPPNEKCKEDRTPVFTCSMAPIDLVLDKLSDEDLHALLAWEFWKDGADWGDLVEDIATGQYLPFNTRVAAIDQLRKVYGYQ
jgi:hypothetical protein